MLIRNFRVRKYFVKQYIYFLEYQISTYFSFAKCHPESFLFKVASRQICNFYLKKSNQRNLKKSIHALIHKKVMLYVILIPKKMNCNFLLLISLIRIIKGQLETFLIQNRSEAICSKNFASICFFEKIPTVQVEEIKYSLLLLVWTI